MWKLTKEYWKDVWVLLWSKTSVDEKAIATVKEIKKRYKLTAQELADVAKAIKEVGNQLGDIDNAIKGKARKVEKRINGKNKQTRKQQGRCV
jgi:chromosome segregation ATPase